MKTIKIIKAEYVHDYLVKLTFNDNSSQVVDFGIFLKKKPHPQHNKYKDLENFKQFFLESGNIVWGENADLIFPVDQLYQGKIRIH